jgi:hypothetical protein
VLALVAEGKTNKDIASALFVSPNTVKTHVTSLLHKMQAETRVQLAAIATKQELGSRAGEYIELHADTSHERGVLAGGDAQLGEGTAGRFKVA